MEINIYKSITQGLIKNLRKVKIKKLITYYLKLTVTLRIFILTSLAQNKPTCMVETLEKFFI